jgi:hypothetical protein
MLLQYSADLLASWPSSKRPSVNPLVSARATGEFFSAQRFIATGEGAYYGETPLMFAACTNQTELVRYLTVEWGADLASVDSQGNNVLHMLVLHQLHEMYDFVCGLWQQIQPSTVSKDGICSLEGLRNRAGLTSLTLAASMGNEVMFDHLLVKRTGRQWGYGPVTCLQVPLAEVDPVGWLLEQDNRHPAVHSQASPCSGSIDFSSRPLSALEVIVNKQQLSLLLHPRIKRLLQKKWETFGRRVFHQRLVAYCIFMVIFSATVVLRSVVVHSDHAGWLWRDMAFYAEQHRWWQAIMCSAGEAVTLAMALWKGWREIAEVREDPGGWRGHFSAQGAGLLDSTLSCVFSSSVLAAALSSFVEGALPTSNACMAVASVAAWSYFLWFLLGFKLVRGVLRLCST